MVNVVIKIFKRIDIEGEHSENFIQLDVDSYKMQEVIWTYYNFLIVEKVFILYRMNHRKLISLHLNIQKGGD